MRCKHEGCEIPLTSLEQFDRGGYCIHHQPPAVDFKARCARLEKALGRVTDSAEMLAAELTDPGTEAFAAIYCARNALSDTGEPSAFTVETVTTSGPDGPLDVQLGEPMTVGDGGKALFEKIAETSAADMRERAAKRFDELAARHRFGDGSETQVSRLYGHAAAVVRALPLTEGKADDCKPLMGGIGHPENDR